jgi:tetratricopeptide (TPR) repeat protein
MKLTINKVIYDEGTKDLLAIVKPNQGWRFSETVYADTIYVRTFDEGPDRGMPYLVGIRELGHAPSFEQLERLSLTFDYLIDAADLDLQQACAIELLEAAYRKYIQGEGRAEFVDYGYNALQDYRHERYEDAAEKFVMAYTTTGSTDALMPLAEVWWRTGKQKEALRSLNSYTYYSPENPQAYCLLGNFLMQQEEREAAERAFETARYLSAGGKPETKPTTADSSQAAA